MSSCRATYAKANCAPSAVAALLGVDMAQVRDAFPWFPARPWTNPTQFGQALTSLQEQRLLMAWWQEPTPKHLWRRMGPPEHQRSLLPVRGLAIVQIDGPWVDLYDPRPAYRHLHTVAVRNVNAAPCIYDANAGTDDAWGGWLPFAEWNREVMTEMVSERNRATGWFVRFVFHVTM